MTFTIGFGLGWLWGILTTLGVIGAGIALKDRRERDEWHEGMDVTLRRVSIEQRKWYNNERVLDAVREVVRDRQDVAWRN